MYPPPQQKRRRGLAPFIIAVILAGALIVGLRTLIGGGGDDPGGGGAGIAQKRACGDDGIVLTIAASSEKAELLRGMANGYNGHRVDGRCVDVVVNSKASGGAMQALARGWDERQDGPRPDVWTPASAGWVALLRQRTEGGDRATPVAADNPTLAESPLVIAMPKPMAQALGWPAKKVGWSEILDLANDPKGWAKYGHPEWGAFRLGKTNPNFSTSGLNATVGAYFAATGLSGDLTEKDVSSAKTRDFVQGVERSIVHYGDTTLTFLSNLQHADDEGTAMSYISAVTVEEKSVWDYNQGNPTGDPKTLGEHAKPKVPLVAIYPKEGTLFSDHPYAVLSWADAARKAAAADFLKYLQAPERQREFEKYAFRTFDGKPGDLITAANGLDPKQPSTTLGAPSPQVLDRILKSWSELRKPANVLMVMDVSGSMGAEVPGTGKTKLDLAKQAAVNALPQFGPNDRVGLWMFSLRQDGDKDYRELVPMDKNTGSRLKDRIEGLIPNGGTGLYDTTLASYRYVMAHRSGDAINAVVFLTDGKNEDNNSISLDDLIPDLRTEAGEDGVRVFTIAYGADADLGTLKKISQTTDAAAYDSRKPGSIDQVFTAVISNF
ncbi:substrate-binding and VWA domain-containing protein [Microbispora sp. ATCC PTA-5024]|uniref:substrate-binding and VWA domain-containing protein n=1 Tax=Microbispora sp. ATCC PTA-5024 TaxID=316330 RepID=UPI0003DC9C60|nr:substrate-binding and VWA domain-containing protein [Microbispora sp. ATCC PTA-5024]ETK33588.1 von Willebrand factor A [Microbispora sp. ATCC PTA-5024]